jgi:hypothetical protein
VEQRRLAHAKTANANANAARAEHAPVKGNAHVAASAKHSGVQLS